MEFSYLIKGIIVGLAVSVPLGPMGVLCIQRTVNNGLKSGYVSGFGITLADTIYALIAGFGISLITDFLSTYQAYLRFIGGGFLIYLGYKVFFTNPAKQFRVQKKHGTKTHPVKDFFSTFLLTLSNPLTLGFFGLVFAGTGFINAQTSSDSFTVMLVSGIFLGAIIWWGVLATIIDNYRHKFTFRILWWVNKVTGVLITGLAIFAIASIFIHF